MTTIKDLDGVVARLNRITNSPMEPYTKQGDKCVANVGNYHLDWSYGGVELCRMHNNKGGVTKPISSGHVSKKELYKLIHAYMNGLLEE